MTRADCLAEMSILKTEIIMALNVVINSSLIGLLVFPQVIFDSIYLMIYGGFYFGQQIVEDLWRHPERDKKPLGVIVIKLIPDK